MKLSFQSKSQLYAADGSVSATIVVMGNSDNASYPVRLAADKISLSNSELEDLAKQKIYEENFPNKAENEKFKLYDEKIAEATELVEKQKEAIQKSDTQLKLITETMNSLFDISEKEDGATNDNSAS